MIKSSHSDIRWSRFRVKDQNMGHVSQFNVKADPAMELLVLKEEAADKATGRKKKGPIRVDVYWDESRWKSPSEQGPRYRGPTHKPIQAKVIEVKRCEASGLVTKLLIQYDADKGRDGKPVDVCKQDTFEFSDEQTVGMGMKAKGVNKFEFIHP